MSTFTEIKQQIAMLAYKLAETKEAERNVAEEVEHWQLTEEEETQKYKEER